MRYLSLSISFVQCVIISRVGSEDIHPAPARINSDDIHAARINSADVHPARINSADDPLSADQLCRRSTLRQRVYIACHFSTFIFFL